MIRSVWMTAAAACLATAGIAAQKDAKAPAAITVTGCLEPGTENTINSQSGPGYKLTHVMMPASSAAKASGYALEGSDADLKGHVGHTIEVSGTIVRKDSATVSGTTPVPVATTGETKTMDNGAPRLRVSTVKMISSDCEKK